MSDYKDILKSAKENGILLDSCGTDERQYWWGLYNDLCGMSVQDALDAQLGKGFNFNGGGDEGSSKKKNTINFIMQKGVDGEYSLYLVPTYPPTSPVIVSFTMDGQQNVVTMPAGVTTFSTGLKSSDNAEKPYAVITDITTASDDESYTYTTKNSVTTGYFALTIDNNGDKTTSQIKYGETVTLPEVEEREGYDFVWTDSNGNEISGNEFVMPEGDVTVTGKYNIQSYGLSYNVTEEYYENGVMVRAFTSGTVTLEYGESVLPALSQFTPALEGKTLSSWKDGDDNVVPDGYTMPAKNLSVSCNYTLNKYTLAFISEGVELSSADYYYEEPVTVESNPSKTGYSFEGWDVEIPATMPAHDITATAIFEAIEYHIYYIIDATTAYTETHHYEDAISIRADEEREGYTFSWEPSALPATMPAEDIEVVGTFVAIDYTFACVVNGETVVERTYHFQDAIEAVEDPQVVGYTFIQWNPEIPETMPSHDVTCEAEFEINTHTITYFVDGVSAYTETHEYGEEISIRSDEEKEGYTFSGWNPAELPATMPDEDIEVVGTFSINSYTITYYVDGNVYSSETYEYATNVTAIAEPEQEGYTFSGWDDVPATMPAHDVEVNGEFTINTYTITYFVDGNEYSSETYEFAATVTPIEEPEQEGYTFSGWDNVPATMPSHDVVVNGEFTINQYTLTYIVDGAEYSAETYDYNAVVTPIEEPEKEGYSFIEWSDMVERMPAHDVEVEAVYQINTYTITYLVDDVEYSAETYEYGATIVPLDEPSMTGYTFSGWTEIPATMPANDVTVNGYFIVNTHTITYFIDNVEYSAETYNYDEIITPINAPEKAGYDFLGWTGIPERMPDEDIEVHANYQIRSWELTYVIENNVFSSMTLEYGTQIVDPDAPEREGYTFAWEEHPATMPDSNLTINGAYEEIQLSTTVYYNTMRKVEYDALTANGISAFTSYDGTEEKQYTAISTVPPDPQCLEWKELATQAEDEEDWDTADYYWDKIDEYAATPEALYAFVAAIPETVSLSKVTDIGGVEFPPVEQKSITIDGTQYTVIAYYNDSPSWRQDGDEDRIYELTIILN